MRSAEERKTVVDRYTGWVEAWGMQLAFAVTQSTEKAERAVADAIVALVTTEVSIAANAGIPAQGASANPDAARTRPAPQLGSLPISITAVRFARTLFELASQQAFRGFGSDAFFRMPVIARAAVVLKAKAKFSRTQIAAALDLNLKQVDDHLENARLLFTEGRPWVQASPGILVKDDRWVTECPQWVSSSIATSSAHYDLQTVFADYIGNDLDHDTSQKLQSHLLVCTDCRSAFANFKRNYSEWSQSIPAVETDPELRKHLAKITRSAIKMNRKASRPPRFLPGFRKTLLDAQVVALLLGLGGLALVHYFLKSQK